LLGAIVGLGIPKSKLEFTTTDYLEGYLVIVDGTDDDVRRAGEFSATGNSRWRVYDAPSGNTARTDYPTTNAPWSILFALITLVAFPTQI